MNSHQSMDELLNSSAIPAEFRPLFQTMRELIDGQRFALQLVQSELATVKASNELAGNLLNEVLVERIDLREQLAQALRRLDRSQKDAAGWKARSELVEKSLKEVLTETIEKPFARFPNRSDN